MLNTVYESTKKDSLLLRIFFLANRPIDNTRITINSTTIYPLRNGNDIIVPFCRLSLASDSFVPSTVREWNSLNLSVRNLETLSKFKKEILYYVFMFMVFDETFNNISVISWQ